MRVRGIISLLAMAMSLYLAARGLMPPPHVSADIGLPLSAVAYLATSLIVLFAPPTSGSARAFQAPVWATIITAVVQAALPWTVSLAVPATHHGAGYVTWYIGACGVLLTVLVVRRRPVVAWSGFVILTLNTFALIGIVGVITRGILGSFLWIVTAQLTVWLVDRIYAETITLTDLQRVAGAWRLAKEAGVRERRERVRFALQVAAPVLSEVIAAEGKIDDATRREAEIAEGTLRDELRGARLLDDDVRRAVREHRERGANVTVLDEGGLDDLDVASLERIRADLARTLATARASRFIVRSAPHGDTAVTVVGRAAESGLSEDDSVLLWREIPRT